ncbi:AAA family ATPase [Persicobacter psychrovividus]|uniref:AAA-ATPase-like domain-containing protein n=1 Tax=Persicobacter psychrovividus TaxID=387638 RepID=A0ABN6LGT5_9BACT|nr:hypothetical protein PEPS_45800 [Persicobacter psychrovividus]
MKALAIGTSDFKEIIETDAYYIDKTLFIEELMVGNKVKSALFPRPRRFGKTLNMSMLKYFFDIDHVEENRKLFKGLAIENSPAWEHQGKYPVIFLTFKELKCTSMEEFLEKFLDFLVGIIENNYPYIEKIEGLVRSEKRFLNRLFDFNASQSDLEKTLKTLGAILNKHHGTAPILLIDEYDAPIHAAHTHGYLPEMLNFMRNFLSAGFKDNEHLTKGIITGILRVAKENIFSGLNNITTYSILNRQFSDKFGLTQPEVDRLLNDADCTEDREKVANWYNGYAFGGTTQIYNPWSILNYVAHIPDGLRAYWVNTSSNELIQEILPKADKATQDILFDLLKGEKVAAQIDEFTVFNDLYAGRKTTVLGLLLFSGYLTAEDRIDLNTYELRIPNQEIKSMFQNMLQNYIGTSITQAKDTVLIQSLLEQRANTFAEALAQYVKTSFSYFDIGKEGNTEKIYHAFMLGLLAHLDKNYYIRSNREVGYGRADIYFYPKDTTNPKAWILEFKKKDADDKGDLKSLAEDALKQIYDRDYLDEIKAHGHTEILCMGVAFEGKQVVCAFDR